MQASLTYMATPEVIGVNCKFQAFSARSRQGLCKVSARPLQGVGSQSPYGAETSIPKLGPPLPSSAKGSGALRLSIQCSSLQSRVRRRSARYRVCRFSHVFCKACVARRSSPHRCRCRCRCRHFPSLLRRCSPPCPVCDQHNTCDTPARAPLPLPPSPTTSSHHYLPGLPRMISPLLPPPQPTACA